MSRLNDSTKSEEGVQTKSIYSTMPRKKFLSDIDDPNVRSIIAVGIAFIRLFGLIIDELSLPINVVSN